MAETTPPNKIKYIHKTSPDYRSYSADGVFGGLTPRGKILMEFFTERFEGPESITHNVTKEGQVGKEIDRKDSKAIVREMQCAVYIDINLAPIVVKWLNEKIDQHKNLSKIKKDGLK